MLTLKTILEQIGKYGIVLITIVFIGIMINIFSLLVSGHNLFLIGFYEGLPSFLLVLIGIICIGGYLTLLWMQSHSPKGKIIAGIITILIILLGFFIIFDSLNLCIAYGGIDQGSPEARLVCTIARAMISNTVYAFSLWIALSIIYFHKNYLFRKILFSYWALLATAVVMLFYGSGVELFYEANTGQYHSGAISPARIPTSYQWQYIPKSSLTYWIHTITMALLLTFLPSATLAWLRTNRRSFFTHLIALLMKVGSVIGVVFLAIGIPIQSVMGGHFTNPLLMLISAVAIIYLLPSAFFGSLFAYELESDNVQPFQQEPEKNTQTTSDE